jgi:hypothetical protein
LAEGGVEDVGKNPSQLRSTVVENGGANVIWAGGFIPLKSLEGAPYLLLLDGERGGREGVWERWWWNRCLLKPPIESVK